MAIGECSYHFVMIYFCADLFWPIDYRESERRLAMLEYIKYCFTTALYGLTSSSLLWPIRRQDLHNLWCIDIMGINGSTFVMVDNAFNPFYFHNDIDIVLQEAASEKTLPILIFMWDMAASKLYHC